MRWGASVLWHHSLPLMDNFNETERLKRLECIRKGHTLDKSLHRWCMNSRVKQVFFFMLC